MMIPPNLKRRAAIAPSFCFTELSLSDEDVMRMIAPPPPVIPSRARRTPKRAHFGVAAGLAFLALPACTSLSPTAVVDATVEVVQLARAAASMQKRVVVSANPAQPGHQGRTLRASARPAQVPAVVDSALLVRADRAMEAGQYRAALAMYQKLIQRKPAQVDALFGAALASHELRQAEGASAYLQRTLALNPAHPLANVLAGFSAQLNKRYGGARDHYARFLSVEDSGERAEEIRSVLAALPAPGGTTVTGAR